ncbi:Uncharacterised protein [Shigella flexneri]|nr:Uncharacterised protein [Shigella flexneri]
MQFNNLFFAQPAIRRDHRQIRSACTTVNHRNFNKARLRFQGLALLPPALQTLYGIQRQRLRITQNHRDIVHAGNGFNHIRHIHQTLRQSPDPLLASQRHRRFQFQHYRRFTYQITTRSLHFRSL